MEGSETLSYGDVTRCDVVSQPVGLLRFTEAAIGFKQRSRGNDQDAIKPFKVPKEEIKGITWAKVTPIKCMLTVRISFPLSPLSSFSRPPVLAFSRHTEVSRFDTASLA